MPGKSDGPSDGKLDRKRKRGKGGWGNDQGLGQAIGPIKLSIERVLEKLPPLASEAWHD
jgi:hypothetical protein